MATFIAVCVEVELWAFSSGLSCIEPEEEAIVVVGVIRLAEQYDDVFAELMFEVYGAQSDQVLPHYDHSRSHDDEHHIFLEHQAICDPLLLVILERDVLDLPDFPVLLLSVEFEPDDATWGVYLVLRVLTKSRWH